MLQTCAKLAAEGKALCPLPFTPNTTGHGIMERSPTTLNKNQLNGGAAMLAEAIRTIFDESQEKTMSQTVSLLGEVEGRLATKIDKEHAQISKRFDGLEKGHVQLARKFDGLEQGHTRLVAKMDRVEQEVQDMRVQVNGMGKQLDSILDSQAQSG